MTVLASYNDRIALGIDSIERSIVYALLLLRYAIKQDITQTQQTDNPYKDAIKIGYTSKKVDQNLEYRFIADAKVPFQSFNSLLAGWAVFENTAEFTNLNPNPFATTTSPTLNLVQAMPVEPDWVDTLEKFLTWASVVLSASLYPETEFVKVQILEEASYPQIYFQYSLPFDHPTYTLTGNLLLALQKLISAYVDDIDDVQVPFVLPASRQFFKDPIASISQLKAVDVSNLPLGTMIVVVNESSPYILGDWEDVDTTDTRFVEPNTPSGNKKWVRTWTDPIYDPELDGTIAGGGSGGSGAVTWQSVLNKPDFEEVAFTGSYNNLLDLPDIPSQILQLAPVKSVNGKTGNVAITGGEIRDGLATLTGDNRLDAAAIKNLPSGGSGSGYSSPEQVRDSLATLTGDNRLDASAIKNLPAGGSGSGYNTPEQVRDSLATLTGDDRIDASTIKNLPAGGGDPSNSLASTIHNKLFIYFPFDGHYQDIQKGLILKAFDNSSSSFGTFSTGKIKQGFKGNFNIYPTITTTLWKLHKTCDFTISCWIKNFYPAQYATSIPVYSHELFGLYYDPNDSNGKSKLYISYNNGAWQNLYATERNPNTWTFIIIRYEQATNTIRFQLRGEITQEIATTSQPNLVFSSNGNQTIVLGKECLIDEFCFWYRYLNNDEIDFLYNSGDGREL